MARAKVFKSGNSQAVRLLKISIQKQGSRNILKRQRNRSARGFKFDGSGFEILPNLCQDIFPEGRNDALLSNESNPHYEQ